MTTQHSFQNGTEGKVCSTCRQWKPLADFGKHRSLADNLTCQCKSCISIAGHLKRTTPEARKKQAARMRKYRQTPSGNKAYRKAGRKTRKQHPRRMSAGSAVAHAIVMNRLSRASDCVCADCGKPAEQYHHESYEKEHWLDVVPLCRDCHVLRHRDFNSQP